MGKLIDLMDERMNTMAHVKSLSRLNGVLAMLLLCTGVWIAATAINALCNLIPYGWAVSALLASSLIAQKSLRDHVRDVNRALSSSLTAGRAAVAQIVGRDTRGLGVSDVVKAALESLAENTADGVVATGVLVLHRHADDRRPARHRALQGDQHGGLDERPQDAAVSPLRLAAARLDDLVNLPASRLTALLFIAAALFSGTTPGREGRARDLAGCPPPPLAQRRLAEAAMAGALNMRFGGPSYLWRRIREAALHG